MSSTGSPVTVWYTLVDSTTGKRFKRATVDCISLDASIRFVAQFRHAVKQKNAEIMTGIVPSQLLVYKNTEAFDTRQETEDGHDGYLDPRKSLDGLGSSTDMLIVAVPSSDDEVIEPSTKKNRDSETENVNVLKYLKQHLKNPPCLFAKHSGEQSWVRFLQKHPNKIITHRNPSDPSSLPVCLLNKAFNDFVHGLKHSKITSKDCEFIGNLVKSMCVCFQQEKERKIKFISLFSEYTGVHLKSTSSASNDSTTDGSPSFPNGALYCNLEVKNEKGCGSGDPCMQSIAYYIKSSPEHDTGSTQHPCFVLELYGTAFSVYGIVNTKTHVICDPLSPTYHLLCNQEVATLTQITMLFASLRDSLKSLYDHKPQIPISSFPFLSSFTALNTNMNFEIQYKEKIKRFLFSAVIPNTNKDVIVKFCSSYNQDVHAYCHSCGFAPKLIAYISDLAYYHVVVMEKLNLRSLTRDDISNPVIRSEIENIAKKLKEKDYVHGDLRDCNIHYDTERCKVVLLDFDWSGCHNVKLYPPFMNPSLPWPCGASTGEPLLQKHDDIWLDRLLNSSS